MTEIHDLQALSRDDLLALWTKLFQQPAPRGISRPFLRRFIAFELQARRFGGLSREFTRRLALRDGGKTITRSPALKPGSRLLREWNGTTHVVDVTNDGFVWNGESHRSLSAIARAITGAHWSGPRFFGLGARIRQ